MLFHAELARTELSKSTFEIAFARIDPKARRFRGRHQEQDAGAGAGVGMRTSAPGGSRTSVRGDALRDAAARGRGAEHGDGACARGGEVQ